MSANRSSLTRAERSQESRLARALARAEYHAALQQAVSVARGTYRQTSRTVVTGRDRHGEPYETVTVCETGPTARDVLAAEERLRRIAGIEQEIAAEGAGGGAPVELTALLAALRDPAVVRALAAAQPEAVAQLRLLAAQPVSQDDK